MDFSIIGRKFGPQVYFSAPSDNEGGITPAKNTDAIWEISFPQEGFTPPKDIVAAFGCDPEIIAKEIGQGGEVVGNRDLVKKINLDEWYAKGKTRGTESGIWYLKRHYLEEPFVAAPGMRDEAMLRHIMAALYPEIETSNKFYHYESKSGIATYVTNEVPSDKDDEHFKAIANDEKFAAKYSMLWLYYGLSDHSSDNTRKPISPEAKGKIAFLDFGFNITDKPLTIGLEKALYDVSRNWAPYVKAGSTMKPFEEVHAEMKRELIQGNGRQVIIDAALKAGKTSEEAEEYFKVVQKNAINYLKHIEMYIAAVNDTLPTISLEEFGFRKSKEEIQNLKAIDFTGNTIERTLAEGEQLVLEIGRGYLQLVERVEGEQIKITNLYGKDNDTGKGILIKKNEPKVIGNGEDSDLYLERCNIRKNHVAITYGENGKISIKDLKSDETDKYRTRIWE